MIYIGFALRNPWARRFELVFDKSYPVTQNKTFEVALYRNTCIVEFGFTITSFKQDHSGIRFDIGIAGYNIEFSFSDNRHYDQRISYE